MSLRTSSTTLFRNYDKRVAEAIEKYDGDWNYWSNPPNMHTIPDGNVGIGTNTPTAALEVVGGIKVGTLISTSADGTGIENSFPLPPFF